MKIRPSPEVEFSSSKIFLHPERLSALTVGDFSKAPISIEVSLTSRCNLDCKWCVDIEWRKRHCGELQPDALLKALREFKAMGTHGVVLEGGGEPTLHKNFEFIVREIKKIGLAVGLITNGVQPLSNDVIKEFEWIRVSLDASTKEEYKAAKGVDAFEKVLANLAAWSKVKEKCVIGVGYLISSYSITDIYGITQRLRDIEVDYVQIRTLDDKEDRNIPIDWKMPPVNDLQTETFKVYTHQLDWEVDASGNLGLPCRAHNLSSVIGSDGSVFFCCRLHSVHLPTGESLGIIGNIYEESVEAIWTGKKREKYIRGMLDPNICQRFCPSCRHTKYNLMIHNLLHTRTPNFI